MFELVVTRHPGLIDYLLEKGMVDENTTVLSHVVDPSILDGKNVCGVLPHALSARCSSFTEIPLDLPPELRGKELDVEQVRRYAQPAVTYRIEKIAVDGSDFAVACDGQIGWLNGDHPNCCGNCR